MSALEVWSSRKATTSNRSRLSASNIRWNYSASWEPSIPGNSFDWSRAKTATYRSRSSPSPILATAIFPFASLRREQLSAEQGLDAHRLDPQPLVLLAQRAHGRRVFDRPRISLLAVSGVRPTQREPESGHRKKTSLNGNRNLRTAMAAERESRLAIGRRKSTSLGRLSAL